MIAIRQLNKKDYSKAMNFAIKGMNFERYTKNAFLLNLYARYFLYTELGRASHILAAYDGDELMGLLIADIKGFPKQGHSLWRKTYIGVLDKLISLSFGEATDSYDSSNESLLAEYKEKHRPDGEITFLAANPDSPVKGIGTLLLQTLEKDIPNKEIYLYTDSNCTYQFYEKRGFERACEVEAVIEAGKTMTCFLYHKKVA
ncbi:GNAT family N-acetyltransferase [Lactococcus ileimucosae]|uniref:GNAT family N-acetyltransferase n=1 Tax=Lactococcus ileimucosae TaxID=2941329 RepID=UPI0035115DC3